MGTKKTQINKYKNIDLDKRKYKTKSVHNIVVTNGKAKKNLI